MIRAPAAHAVVVDFDAAAGGADRFARRGCADANVGVNDADGFGDARGDDEASSFDGGVFGGRRAGLDGGVRSDVRRSSRFAVASRHASSRSVRSLRNPRDRSRCSAERLAWRRE